MGSKTNVPMHYNIGWTVNNVHYTIIVNTVDYKYYNNIII